MNGKRVAYRYRVIGASIVAIYFIHNTNANVDTTYGYWPVKISLQIVQCMSIVTACIPFLKPFLELLDSSVSGVTELRRRMIAGTCNSSCDGFGNVDDDGQSDRKRGMVAAIGSVPALPSLPSIFGGRGSGEIDDEDHDREADKEDGAAGERGNTRRESRKESRRESRRESKGASSSKPGYIHRNTSVVESSSRAQEQKAKEDANEAASGEAASSVGYIKQTTSFSVERGDDRAGALLPLGLLKY